ncbi:sigma factor regulator N-terminal domain-containing protein [Shouchella patagoniensis]|uniref:sigma factor regulator N-terminal domain-containing protein n=1 Tax=Shouchella patagoniensis TaxID=228576 RepID=UPI001475CA2E|nr:sigma factor regulator N-terminal domain-containing protein [Shouchella patagoniensis]
MDCNEVNKKWNDYLEVICLSLEERDIEEHLKTCPKCSYKLDSAIEDQNESFLAASYKNATEHVVPLSSKAQKKLIFRAKWKNRMSNAITMFCLFIIISIASGIFTGLFFGIGPDGGRGTKTAQVLKTATQMTMPNVFLQGINQQTNFFFTMDLNTEIQKEIGKEYKTIGKFNGTLFFNQLNVERDWHDSTYNVQLYFLHPHYIDNYPSDSDKYRSDMKDVWEALEILPEGTVAELAISFDDLYEIDDMSTRFWKIMMSIFLGTPLKPVQNRTAMRTSLHT